MNRRRFAAALATAATAAVTLAATNTVLSAGNALAAGTVAQTATSSATPTSADGCHGRWPASVQGQPTLLKTNAARGIYLWHSTTGWKLRATHRTNRKVVFSGTITTNQPMRERPVKLEGNDYVALSADRKTIHYRLTNYGKLDGFDFRTSCATTIRVNGKVQGRQMTWNQVFLGRANRHPTSVPFTIQKLLAK